MKHKHIHLQMCGRQQFPHRTPIQQKKKSPIQQGWHVSQQRNLRRHTVFLCPERFHVRSVGHKCLPVSYCPQASS